MVWWCVIRACYTAETGSDKTIPFLATPLISPRHGRRNAAAKWQSHHRRVLSGDRRDRGLDRLPSIDDGKDPRATRVTRDDRRRAEAILFLKRCANTRLIIVIGCGISVSNTNSRYHGEISSLVCKRACVSLTRVRFEAFGKSVDFFNAVVFGSVWILWKLKTIAVAAAAAAAAADVDSWLATWVISLLSCRLGPMKNSVCIQHKPNSIGAICPR